MLLKKTLRKARKDHRCCECGKVIPAGNSYEVASALNDCASSVSSYKTCLTCVERIEHAFASLSSMGLHSDEGPAYREFYQWYYEVHGVEYKD